MLSAARLVGLVVRRKNQCPRFFWGFDASLPSLGERPRDRIRIEPFCLHLICFQSTSAGFGVVWVCSGQKLATHLATQLGR